MEKIKELLATLFGNSNLLIGLLSLVGAIIVGVQGALANGEVINLGLILTLAAGFVLKRAPGAAEGRVLSSKPKDDQ